MVDDVPNVVLNAIDETLPEFKAECIETGAAQSLHAIACDVMGSVGGNKIDIDVSADSSRMIVTDQKLGFGSHLFDKRVHERC